jgi:putative transcriptional regulator
MNDGDLTLAKSAVEITDADRMKRTPQVKVVRQALGFTQQEFAERFNIALGTLRDWEQGRKEPDQAARNYLKMIAVDPDLVLFALGQVQDPADREAKAHGRYGLKKVWFVYRRSEDPAYWGSVIVNRVEAEADAAALARQFAEDHPGIRYGYGSWTPVTPNTAEMEYLAAPDGTLMKMPV